METAKQHLKEHFQQSQVLIPVFFLVSAALTLISAGCTYTLTNLRHIAKPCFTAGAVLALLSVVYSIAMIFLLPYFKEFYQRFMQSRPQTAVAETTVEDGLNTCSEDVIAADGEGIAFGPKRRKKTERDKVSELFSKEKKDGHRESDSRASARGSLDSQTQSRKDSSGRRLSRSGKPSFMGQAMIDFGEQDESVERAAERQLLMGQENPLIEEKTDSKTEDI